jgi:mono/diheme cytochrome c family protein
MEAQRVSWGRRLAKALAALVLLLAVAVLVLYLATQPMLRGRSTPAFTALPKGDAIEGARLAAIVGCTDCHRADLGGRLFLSIPNVADLVGPDLSRVREKYDDAGLLRVLRAGVKRDGYYALGMPGFMQQRLNDREAADIIAFVRSVPPAANPTTQATRTWPLGRLGVLLGKYRPYEGDDPESAVVLRDRAEPRVGRHLVQIACTECHGKRLEGDAIVGAPALAIARAYTPEQFRTLMRTGTTLAGTQSKTGLMSKVAVHRFSHLSDAEIADIHAWLTGPEAGR